MCNPTWTGIEDGSVLEVSVKDNTGVGVECRKAISMGGGSPTGSACTLPLSQPITAGMDCTVFVNAASTGGASTVTVVARVTKGGAVVRGPDECTLGALVVTDVIMASGV